MPPHGDFGVPAKWHFSATLHGKSACNGVGDTVKRLAARAAEKHNLNDFQHEAECKHLKQ